MREYQRIRAAVIRGGTSKGVFVLAGDLPAADAVRDRVILAMFGSPDPRQINGLGGGDPLTSKIAIIARSARPGADVDYTVGHVRLDQAMVDYEANCGNISQGVGPFAVDEGLVALTEPVTLVRIFNTNTGKMIEAEVPVREGKARVEGDFAIPGVPGTGARIVVNFVNSGGSKTGRLLPTGNVQDRMQLADGRTLRVSLVDAGNPSVFVQARELGLTGRELPAEASANPWILALMEEIRGKAAVMMKLAASPQTASAAIPKVAFVAQPQDYVTNTGKPVAAAECDLLARAKAFGTLHKAYAVTGGLCVGAAALIEGSVVHEVVDSRIRQSGVARVGHPSGVTPYLVTVVKHASGEFELTKSAMAGTARRIMDGFVYVPSRVFV
jgi:2-methylaconitate cis-trans-isomerase PrpF